MVLHALHLCSGYGGFELALRLAGIPARTVAHVERDAYAAATLVARMEDATLDRAPVWSDLATFDADPWRGRVDIVTAGLPCQPFSAAGAKQGLDDPRHLWPHARRIIAAVGPRFVLLENVPDVVRAGWLANVLADLADLGFDAEWGMLRASDLGAPHVRRRFWLLGYTDGEGRPEVPSGAPGDEGPDGWRSDPADESHGAGEDVADADGAGRAAVTARSEVAGTGDGGVRAWPPTRDDADGWAEWVAQGGPQPALCRITDGPPAGLADSLHLGGNGLVPVVAAAALLALAERAGIDLGGGVT